MPELDRDTPLVIGLDAGVSHDGFALVGVTRHWEEARDEEVAVRLWQLWLPPPGGEVSFDEVFQEVQILLDTYNVVEIVYDPSQLVESSQRLRRLNRVPVHKFEQGKPRALADQALYERIRDRRIVHCSPAEIREHLLNAVAKRTSDDSQRRIGKRAERALVDLAVALAMASFECGRLNL